MGTLRELHPNPRFTKHLVEKRIFENDPLVVVDVGARKGFEKHWNHYNDQIKLIGFEPNEDSYKNCIEQKSNSRTTYYPYALDIDKGEKDFYITAYPSASGFYPPNNKMVVRFGHEDYLDVTKIIKVSTIDLDSFLNENSIKNVDFIKLDTEGSELNILKGAENILTTSVLGLSVEVEFIEMFANQPLFSDIDQFLRSLGFELYDLDINRLARNSLSPYSSANLDIGQVVFAQALYLRDVVSELENNTLNIDLLNQFKILKMASIQEIFNLPDCAIELIQKGQSFYSSSNNDIKLWIEYLVPLLNGENVSYNNYLYYLRVNKPRIDYLKNRKYSKLYKFIPWPLDVIIKRILLKLRDFLNLFL